MPLAESVSRESDEIRREKETIRYSPKYLGKKSMKNNDMRLYENTHLGERGNVVNFIKVFLIRVVA